MWINWLRGKRRLWGKTYSARSCLNRCRLFLLKMVDYDKFDQKPLDFVNEIFCTYCCGDPNGCMVLTFAYFGSLLKLIYMRMELYEWGIYLLIANSLLFLLRIHLWRRRILPLEDRLFHQSSVALKYPWFNTNATSLQFVKTTICQR
jgi:hypothetical protein